MSIPHSIGCETSDGVLSLARRVATGRFSGLRLESISVFVLKEVEQIDGIFGIAMPSYETKATDKVERAVHEEKRGQLRSGSGKRVTSRTQAIAIGLSQARKAGAKVPAKTKA